MNIFKKQIAVSQQHIPAIQDALLETYFSTYDQDFLLTEAGRIDIENNVFKRYNHSLRHVVPWLNRHIDLEGKRVLEIGCGTGSSTAALAHYVQYIEGYDINTLAVQGARKRLEIMGLRNVRLHIVTENELIRRISEDTQDRYDIILLYAVLEHQTITERHDTLETCWDLLAEGGIMSVIDTPNILHYYDLHTSQLPFLHMLPDRLYARYAEKSARSAFAKSFSDEKKKSARQLDVHIARWGRGASYHDFELVLGEDYKDCIVAEGFEPEIIDWFPCTIEEEMLRWYVQHKEFDIPLGFTRCVLNLIFRKGLGRNTIPRTEVFQPPPSTIFKPDLMERITALEQQLQKKNSMITEIYNSSTWRAGSLLAIPYRKIKQFLKK